MSPPPRKINLISCESMTHVSDIKLIRTDTTLDLSQKAEKGMLLIISQLPFYSLSSCYLSVSLAIWDKNLDQTMFMTRRDLQTCSVV
ncbi:hypothetical protein PTKIN_Ptkin17bG0020200 [Pterospermum kingtungense]